MTVDSQPAWIADKHQVCQPKISIIVQRLPEKPTNPPLRPANCPQGAAAASITSSSRPAVFAAVLDHESCVHVVRDPCSSHRESMAYSTA